MPTSWQDAGTGWSWGSQEPVWQAPPRPLQLRGNQEAQGSQTQGPGPPPSAGKPLASPPQSQCRWGPRTVPVTSATQLTHLGPEGLLCPGPLHTGTRSSRFSHARLRGRMRTLSARRSACPAWSPALPRRGSRAPARPLLPSHGGLKSARVTHGGLKSGQAGPGWRINQPDALPFGFRGLSLGRGALLHESSG